MGSVLSHSLRDVFADLTDVILADGYTNSQILTYFSKTVRIWSNFQILQTCQNMTYYVRIWLEFQILTDLSKSVRFFQICKNLAQFLNSPDFKFQILQIF